MTNRRIALLTALLLCVAAPACAGSFKSHDGAAPDAASRAPGVTDTTITLGVLTDLTGPFAAAGKAITRAQQLYFEKRNAEGGICQRTVEVVVQDHGYNVQRAVSLYADTTPKVAGYVAFLGAAMLTAVLDDVESDEVVTVPVAWASTLLANPYVMMVGATYDVQIINGIEYLIRQGKLREGDRVGHIYLEGEYGSNALAGAKYAGREKRLAVVEQKIRATDQDMTAQVASLRAARVKAIVLSTTPKQTASVAAAAAAGGFDVPILGDPPTFIPELLGTAAAQALVDRLLIVQSMLPVSADEPVAREVAEAYESRYPNETLQPGIVWGYAAAQLFANLLERACADGDLSRRSVGRALRSMAEADTGGLLPVLDFTEPGALPTREVLIARPDPAARGGLALVVPFLAGELAQRYRGPAEARR